MCYFLHYMFCLRRTKSPDGLCFSFCKIQPTVNKDFLMIWFDDDLMRTHRQIIGNLCNKHECYGKELHSKNKKCKLKLQKKMLAWNYLLFLVCFCDVYGDWANYLYSQVILCTLVTSMESGMQQHYSTSPVSHLCSFNILPTLFTFK